MEVKNVKFYVVLCLLLTPSYWLQGGFVVAISKTVHPRLHISTARLQPFEFFITWKEMEIWTKFRSQEMHKAMYIKLKVEKF